MWGGVLYECIITLVYVSVGSYVGTWIDGSVVLGHYSYMDVLRTLEGMVSTLPCSSQLSKVNTPLEAGQWESMLRDHPDREFAEYLVRGVREIFRIGFERDVVKCRSAKRNMQSAIDNPTAVAAYLEKECRVVGPLPKGSIDTHVSRFGVVPKLSQPVKWRLIVDLSHPDGVCVNEGIRADLCSLVYSSVDNAIDAILEFGPGSLLAKLDLEIAYRNVPVHPTDRPLLGMVWEDALYIDTALPFGLRSAPKSFSALADGLIWMMGHRGVQRALRYLDDYLFFGRAGSQECTDALQVAVRVCGAVGMPVAMHKCEGPATSLVFWVS